jgi:hypothetical protein
MTYWFFNSGSTRSAFDRCEYHDLTDISGISAAIQGSKTIGLFCHQRHAATSFKSFVARLDRTYPNKRLIFLYFPLNRDEKIQAVGVRRIPDLRFPTNTPVIQVHSPAGLLEKKKLTRLDCYELGENVLIRTTA